MKQLEFMIVLLLIWIAPAIAGEVEDVMPNPLPGWHAGEVQLNETQDNMFGMPITRRVFIREYFSNKDNGGIAIMIDTFDCIAVTIMDTLHNDADFRTKNKKQVRPIVVKGRNGMESYGNGGELDMVSVKIDSCMLVSVGGAKPLPGSIGDYLNILDLERIRKIKH